MHSLIVAINRIVIASIVMLVRITNDPKILGQIQVRFVPSIALRMDSKILHERFIE